MAGRLNDKVALVTGGASGIGKATSLAFAQEGARVAVADMNVEGGEESVRLIQEAGGEAFFVRADVARSAQVAAMVNKVVERYGRLDCAFNNAAIVGVSGSPAADTTEEVWDQVISINLTGVWLCMKYEIQQMLKQGNGAIVNTASVMGLVGTPNAAYTASKHGVIGLTKSAALSYSQAGIRINAVCPGFTDSPMIAPLIADDTIKAELISRHPIGRLGTAEEVAEAVVWLSSDAASFMSGHSLAVDGGYTAR